MKKNFVLLFALCAISAFLQAAAPALNPGTWFTAAKAGDIDTIQEYIDKGFSVDEKSPHVGDTALLLATASGHRDIVELLLEHGANVDVQDNYGTTALMAAANRGNRDMVELLLEHGANPNKQMIATEYTPSDTALIYAAARGQLDIVKLLLQHGADIDKPNDRGNTALAIAMIHKHPDVVKYLLGRGADYTRNKSAIHIYNLPFTSQAVKDAFKSIVRSINE